MKASLRPGLILLALALNGACLAFDATAPRLGLEKDPFSVAQQTEQYLQQHSSGMPAAKRLELLQVSAEASLLTIA